MKISFCITCKDRLFYLSQTLPLNILNSSDYFEKEFILMDYNSQDGLYEWAKSNLHYWESKGIVKYLRTDKPKYFSAAHAKNIAHKNATGEILCNLDCDNFIRPGFCQYLEQIFKNPKVIFYSSSEDIFRNNGCCGKIASTRETFYSVNGYDESASVNLGWGWDDVSFRERAKRKNGLKDICCDLKYNLAIDHSNATRTQNFVEKNILKSQQDSIKALTELVMNNCYVVNEDTNWGFVDDLKIGLNR